MTQPAPPDPAAARDVIDTYAPPSASAVQAVLAAVLRHLLTALGATLVAHGWIDAAAADAAIDGLTQELLGALLIGAAALGAAARAELSHSRWADAWAVLTGAATIDHPEDHA